MAKWVSVEERLPPKNWKGVIYRKHLLYAPSSPPYFTLYVIPRPYESITEEETGCKITHWLDELEAPNV